MEITNEQINDLIEKFGDPRLKPEPLHRDLQAALEPSAGIGEILRHDLVCGVPYLPNMNDMYNRNLVAKRHDLEQALEEKNWSKVIALHERYARLNAVLKYMHCWDEDVYSEQLLDVWTDAENPGVNENVWSFLFASPKFNRNLAVRVEDRHLWDALPEQVHVYRGCKEQYVNGMSWTLSETVATWFANRWGSDGTVASKFVPRSEILALTDCRSEMEVILQPE